MGFSLPSIEQGGPKCLTRPILGLYGFCFLLPGSLLPIPHFAMGLPLASLAAVFHIASGRGERLPAVSANTFAHPACCRLLAVKFRPAIRRAKQSVRPLGLKFLPTTFADQFERLADRVFAGLDLLIAFPALDQVCSAEWWWVRANAGSAGHSPALSVCRKSVPEDRLFYI